MIDEPKTETIGELTDRIPAGLWVDVPEYGVRIRRWGETVTVEPVPSTITHLCPEVGSGVTGCCGRTPFELPQTDRLTLDSVAVTCSGLPPREAE